jgi:hypothetical protein
MDRLLLFVPSAAAGKRVLPGVSQFRFASEKQGETVSRGTRSTARGEAT